MRIMLKWPDTTRFVEGGCVRTELSKVKDFQRKEVEVDAP